MIFGKAGFGGAVADFEAAVTAQDAKRSGKAFVRLQETFGQAREAELLDGGPRLAAVLEQVPPGPVPSSPCLSEPASSAARMPSAAHRGCWPGCGGPWSRPWCSPTPGSRPVAACFPFRTAASRARSPWASGFDAAVGWWTLPQWEMAAVAMLNHPGVRRAVSFRGEALRLLGAVERASGTELKSLAYALLVLDDEPLVALHRASGTGYLLRLSGIGDNFQLHTLLADALIGGGHVEGHAPSSQEAAVCRETPGQVDTVGSFDLVAPDGEIIWNEGAPADIPVVDGVRLLVLDEPSYRRSWPAGRFFPGMRGDALLERPLDPEETERWYAHVSPAKDATG